jgi:ABC-type sugar transport system permease subunit/ABC-type glycerol-3-phosphate transport system substrate-binding protein
VRRTSAHARVARQPLRLTRAASWVPCALVVLALSVSVRFARADEVEYWHVGEHNELRMLERVAERFHAKTGIRVKLQIVPWGHFQTKYFTAMAAGTPPDAGSTNLSAPGDFGKDGGLVDLGRRFPAAVQRLRERTFPGVWANCTLEGRLYGVPYNATPLIGYYRRDVFARLGLEPPATWSELSRVIEALNAADYRYGFIWTRNDAWGLGTYTRPFGVVRYAERDGQPVANWLAPGFIRGFRFAVELWNAYDMALDKPLELFIAADSRRALPLYFSYALDYMAILVRAPQLRDTFGILPFPRRDGHPPMTIAGGRTVVVFRRAKNPRGAMRWIEYLLSTEVQLFQYRYLRDLGEQSQLSLSITRDFWQQDLGMRPGDQQRFHQVYRHLQTLESIPWVAEADKVLDRSLERAQQRLRQQLAALAAQQGVSVTELKRRFARGALPEQKKHFAQLLDTTSREVLREALPQANSLLQRGRQRYLDRRLPPPKASTEGLDVLDIAELALALLIAAAIALIATRRPLRSRWVSYLYVAPPVLLALLFVFVPMVVSLYLSFTRYNPVAPLGQERWVGLENYALVLRDPELWQSLMRSFYFTLLVLPSQLFLSLGLAACLDRRLWPGRLYRFIYFSPLVTSIVSVALIWFALLAGAEYGWVNALLLRLGIVVDPIHFLDDKRFFLESAITVSIWQGMAFYILILLAGLQSVPETQYEAASIDGAGPLRQFLHVSLPSLRPQIIFLTVMGTIGAVQVFEQIYMLGGGAGESGSKFGPDDSGMTMVPYIYRTGFELLRMGQASAVAYVLFAVLIILTVLNLRALARRS